MYESEANRLSAPQSEIPAEILSQFAESRTTVRKKTLIPWGEHCTECVWPTCYTSCDLYSPREDLRCRRFVEGMVRVDCPDALNSYIVKLSFKRWAKLWSKASLRLHSLDAADRAERRDLGLARSIQIVPVESLRRTIMSKRYSMKKRSASRDREDGSELPNCFMVECYNPNAEAVPITLTIRRDGYAIPFQALLSMEPGFNRKRIGVSEIGGTIDLSGEFNIDLTPGESAAGLTLYFGAMDFVIDEAFALPKPEVKTRGSSKPKICKCVVWDLDNTLWDGILMEDGADAIRLKPNVVEILKELDRRGILLSVASKNNHEEALAVLERFGISEYFLFPQISWAPKSKGIQDIAADLNIGRDSIVFIDDSEFEREQVKAVCPDVTVLDATDYLGLLERQDCNLPVTEESQKRRFFYREQQTRVSAERAFGGDYLTFLRDCKLQLTIRPLEQDNLERIYELAQRTNQMNFSGNRYSREQLAALLKNDAVDTYSLECDDRFGKYGIIGFCTVNRPANRMTDLMFSCRIQSKRVEHAFVAHLLRKYREMQDGDFYVDYRKTSKNAAPGKVFEDLGFVESGEANGVTQLVFSRSQSILDEAVIALEDTTEKAPAGSGASK